MPKLELYNLYRELMMPFDLFMWSGKGGLSDIIKNVTKSPFSHASVGVWMQPIIGCPIRHFNAESTTLNNVPDAFYGDFRKGVQIVNFSQRLDGYDGEVWWVPLKEPFTEQQKLDMTVWLLQKEADRTQYDLDQGIKAVQRDSDTPLWARILATPFASLTPNTEDFGKLFCSEMVCKLYKIAGRIPQDVNASTVTPNELLEFNIYKDPVKII